MSWPDWLQRFASWLDATVNYGARGHVVHWPAGSCHTCEAWAVHDDCFNEASTWSVTAFGELMQEEQRR